MVFSLLKVPTSVKLRSLSTKLITDGQQRSLKPHENDAASLKLRKRVHIFRKFVNNSRYDTPWLPTPAVLFTFIRGNLSLLYVKMLSRGQQSRAQPASCTAHRIFMAKRTSLAVLIRVLFSKVRISICVKFWCGRNVGNDHPQNHKCHCGRNVFLQTLA